MLIFYSTLFKSENFNKIQLKKNSNDLKTIRRGNNRNSSGYIGILTFDIELIENKSAEFLKIVKKLKLFVV